MFVGTEWIIDAFGCDPSRLRDPDHVVDVAETILRRLELSTVAPPVVHVFPGEAGVTAMYLLAESHLCVHTYPEHALATLNVYCCRPRPNASFEAIVTSCLGAARVTVRSVARGE